MRLGVILVAVLISGCSAMDALNLAKHVGGGTGPSVSAQVGKEANKQVVVGDQNKHETELDIGAHSEVEVSTDSRKVETAFDGDVQAEELSFTNYPDHFIYALVVFAMLGWVLPTPLQMWRARRGKHE